VARLGPALHTYLDQHVHPTSLDGRPWTVAVHETQNPLSGPYRELTAQVRLTPPAGEDVRHFSLAYDAVVQQVVTHKVMVVVRQDWARGQVADTLAAQLGLIELDVCNNVIPPLPVNLDLWTGFGAMVQLGAQHIAAGTDHLLFLLLLLPAPLLLTRGRRWWAFGGVRLPGQPVEVLIAVFILVSAVHAVRPLFPGRTAWVAAGFGSVHGLAFASTLTNLHLGIGSMALRILGFNLGIELLQLLVYPHATLAAAAELHARLPDGVRGGAPYWPHWRGLSSEPSCKRPLLDPCGAPSGPDPVAVGGAGCGGPAQLLAYPQSAPGHLTSSMLSDFLDAQGVNR